MRPDARSIDRFLHAPPAAIRAVLLHGDDHGLIQERGTALTRAVAGSSGDAFRVAVLDRDGHDRLAEEAGALSLVGGRRVVRVREAADALTATLERLLAGPCDALLVLEAGTLGRGSRLRALLEPRPDAAVITCYPEDAGSLAASVEIMVRDGGARITREARDALVPLLGADRMANRSEVEKLVLYAGEGGTIDIDAVDACVADGAALSLEDALFAATAGDLGASDRALERALADGAAPVAVARAVASHLDRLSQARRLMDGRGVSAVEAGKSVRPPVFFKRVPLFAAALGRWTLRALAAAAAETQATELACKRTGAPDEALVRHLVQRIARAGARATG